MSREHVYYSGSTRRVGLPARVVWYVSGVGPGGKSVRAVSRLEEVVIGRPRTVHRRFQHLGVWREHQVESAASKHGQVLALRFSDTELLRRPIPLPELQQLAAEACHTLVLQSIGQIPEALFASIYTRGQS